MSKEKACRRESECGNSKKIPAHLYATTRMKYEAIEANSPIFEVRKMCQVFGLKASNYYRFKKQREHANSRHLQEIEDIRRVEKIFYKSDKIYGYRMIGKQLEKEGTPLSEYRIRRIMRENGYYPETSKKYTPTHNGKSQGKFHQNHVKQEFQVCKPNEVWVGDITYIKTVVGWVYLAVVIDLYNREIIGYTVSKKIDTELVKRAMSNALANRGGKEGLIFHSDRGCQYSSIGYREMLLEHKIQGSMSRPGCPYDNACAESFFATIKKERIYRRKYSTIEEVKSDLFQYIEIFYNRKRMHSVLDYMSPVAYRMRHCAEDTA